jgi:hypothetical protein
MRLKKSAPQWGVFRLELSDSAFNFQNVEDCNIIVHHHEHPEHGSPLQVLRSYAD